MKKNISHHFYTDGAFSVVKSIIFLVLPIKEEKSSILSMRTRIEGIPLVTNHQYDILSMRTRIEGANITIFK